MGRVKKAYDDRELTVLLKNVCRKLKAYREELGLSQNQLSKKSGIALSTINEIENEVVKDMRFSTVSRLSRILGRKPIELLTESDLNLSDPDRKDFGRAVQSLLRISRKLS